MKLDEIDVTINVSEQPNISDPIKGSSEVVVIAGKEYKANQFKPGNSFIGGKPHVNTDKKITRLLRVGDKKEFRAKVSTIGLTRLWAIMEKLPDIEFMRAMLVVLPYAMPKIAAIDNSDKENKVHNIDDAQQVHTITIKDMRTGLSKKIVDK